jgi:hypothetical protein
VQSSKASDGDVDERDRRMEAAASMPARMPTRPGQGAAKAKPSAAKAGNGAATAKAPSKATTEAKPASTAKSAYEADQRKRSDMIVALTKAEREATTPLAKQKIAESKRKMLDEYANAGKAEERKNYVPRATPGARAPKQTTSKAKPYMPEKPDMSFRKGGSVSSASKRADGIAQRGKTRA